MAHHHPKVMSVDDVSPWPQADRVFLTQGELAETHPLRKSFYRKHLRRETEW